MDSAIVIDRLTAGDLAAIVPQRSQRVTLGIETATLSVEEAEQLAAATDAWAIRAGDRLIGCIGIRETFPGAQGVAWATLADGIGGAHLAMTRFARSCVLGSALARVEAIVPAADAESVLDAFPGLDAQQLLDALLATPTPEMVWARLVGLKPAHVLRKFGAAAQTYILCERIG